MIRLAELSIRFPKRVLAFWVVVAAIATVFAFGIGDQLSPSKTVIPGTESAHAEKLATQQFGPSVLVPILLQGPAAQIDTQGPKLVAALQARSDTKVLSPWAPQQESLRPKPTAAMIVASVARSEAAMVDGVQAQINRTVDQNIALPVKASITGQPSVDIALKNASLDATVRGALIALPLLLLLLIALLRRPIAALVVTFAVGFATLAGIGVLSLMARLIDTDPIAVPSGMLTGIALGGVFAMTMTQRFLNHHGDGPPRKRGGSAELADHVVRLSGRGVLVGGTCYLVALVVASRIAPSDALTSVGIGSLICAAVTLVLLVMAMPAALVLLGRRLDVLAFSPPRDPHQSPDQRFVTKHAGVAGFVATVALAALAIGVLSLQTGPPAIAQLPSDSSARKNFETVNNVMGAGWATPFSIVLVDHNKPITTSATLKSIAAFQDTIARDPRVASVAGPGSFVQQTADLKKLPKSLNDSKKLLTGGKKDLRRLEQGLGQAGAGADQLQSGLVDASSGATQLAGGGDQAHSGSAKLHAGLASARAGSAKISNGLGQALTGAEALRNGASQALGGVTVINSNLGALADPVTAAVPQTEALASAVGSAGRAVGSATTSNNATVASLNAAIAALDAMGIGQTDPNYAATLAAATSARTSATSTSGSLSTAGSALAVAGPGTEQVAAQVATLSSALTQLHAGAGQLQTGIAQLQKGNTDLRDGIGKLNNGGQDLTSGLGQLTTGAGTLETGLGQLSTGAGALAVGLSGAVGPTGQLSDGLGTMHAGVKKFAGQLPSPKDLEKLQKSSPNLFTNGYFVLAAISGAPPADRNVASFAVNIDQGGTAGQVVVIAKQPPDADATQQLAGDLQTITAEFGKTHQLETAVGGQAGNLIDYQDETTSRIAPAVAGVAIAVTLLLMLLLRSILIPLAATAAGLLATAATFGIMELLFGGDNPLFGGPGYIDPMSIIAVFAAAFGLSAVFAGILLDEVRQELVADGDLGGAVEKALRRSARAGMIGGVTVALVSIPFIAEDLLNLRQFATGFAIMALLDVLIVRALLLPAIVEILRVPAWWPTVAHEREQPTPPPTIPGRPVTH